MYNKFSKILKYLSGKCLCWSTYFNFISAYETYKKTGKVNYILKTNMYKNRNIGKTYSLVKIATKYNIPIYVSTKMAKKRIEEIARIKFNKKINVIVLNNEGLNRTSNKTIALFDELNQVQANIIIKNFINFIGTIYEVEW